MYLPLEKKTSAPSSTDVFLNLQSTAIGRFGLSHRHTVESSTGFRLAGRIAQVTVRSVLSSHEQAN